MSPEVKAEIYRNARRLIVEKGWTQGYFSRDENGKEVDFTDASACSYCVVGAILAASAPYVDVQDDSLSAVMEFIVKGGIVQDMTSDLYHWNDENYRTREDVLAYYDREIEKCVGEK